MDPRADRPAIAEPKLAVRGLNFYYHRFQALKNIENLERQFADTASLSRKPEHIVQNMRQKLDEYKIQRDKLTKAI